MTFEAIDFESVITVQDSEDLFLVEHSTFRLSEFDESVYDRYEPSDVEWKWFRDGVECEVLQPRKGWRKGKVRLIMAFFPDEVEQVADTTNDCSELDALRKPDAHWI